MKKKKNEAGNVEATALQMQAVLAAEGQTKALRHISLCITAMAIAYILPKLLLSQFGFIRGCVEDTFNNCMESHN